MDTIHTSTVLVIETMFVDGDTRTITVKNPDSGIVSNDIRQLNTFLQTNNFLIGDKAGATFGKIRTAKRRTITTATKSFNQQS